jgi:hypothetical protein
MAVQNPAIFLQAGSHPAEDVRRFISTLMGDRPGIIDTGDLAVTQTATASMSVDVAGGRAFIDGTEFTYQGLYFVENRGTTNLAVAPADSTNARYDLVVARVKDEAYSGTTSAWALEVVTGTPSDSPIEPSAPANSLVLARTTVAAGATSITDADIQPRHERTWVGQPSRHLLTLNQSSEARATSTTRVSLPGLAGSFTLSAARRVIFTLDVQTAQGVSGGELGRVTLVVDGVESRRTQWHSPAPGGSGDVSPALTYSASLAAGSHSVDANVLRVTGGSEVLVSAAQLVVVDGGPE